MGKFVEVECNQEWVVSREVENCLMDREFPLPAKMSGGGGRWKGGSGWGTRIHPWLINVNVWQNHYNIIK